MRLRVAFASGRTLTLAALALSASIFTEACSRQAEGERCSFETNDHGDCDDRLLCIPADQLRDDSVDRCCPAEGVPISDERCQRSLGGGGSGGQGGTGGEDAGDDDGGGGEDGGGEDASSEGGAAGNDAGATCTFNSDCPEGLVCGPLGVCRAECLADRDCATGLVCEAITLRCIAPPVPDASSD
jgi:hypothetical protein